MLSSGATAKSLMVAMAYRDFAQAAPMACVLVCSTAALPDEQIMSARYRRTRIAFPAKSTTAFAQGLSRWHIVALRAKQRRQEWTPANPSEFEPVHRSRRSHRPATYAAQVPPRHRRILPIGGVLPTIGLSPSRGSRRAALRALPAHPIAHRRLACGRRARDRSASPLRGRQDAVFRCL